MRQGTMAQSIGANGGYDVHVRRRYYVLEHVNIRGAVRPALLA